MVLVLCTSSVNALYLYQDLLKYLKGFGSYCADTISIVKFAKGLWLIGCFGFNGPLRQYFSLYRAVDQREGETGEKR